MSNPTVTIDLLGNLAPLNQSLGRARDALGRFVKQGTMGSRAGGGGGSRGVQTVSVFGSGGGGAGRGGGGGGGAGSDDDGGMNLGGLIGKAGSALAALYALKKGVDFVGAGISLNAQMEDAKTSIATMLGMFGDDRGFGDRMKVAGGVVEEIRQKGLLAEATFSELLNTYGAIAGTAISAGVTEASDQINLMVAGSQALKVLNGDQANLAAELNRALSGQLKTGDKLLLVNGLTKDAMNKAIKEGNALKFIMEKLAPVIKDGKEGLTNWGSQITLLKENWQTFQSAVAAPIFDHAKNALIWINEKLGVITAEVKVWAGTVQGIFANGDAGSVLSLALQIGAADGIEYMAGLLFAVFSAAGEVLLRSLVRLGDGDFWVAVGDIMVGLAKVFLGTMGTVGAYLLDGFASAVDFLAAGMMVASGKFKNVFNSDTVGNVMLFAETMREAMLNPLAELGKGLMTVANYFAQAMSSALKGDFSAIGAVAKPLYAALNPVTFLLSETAKKVASVASGAKAGITIDEALKESKGTGKDVLTSMGIDTGKMKDISGVIASSGVEQAAKGAAARLQQLNEDVANPIVDALTNFTKPDMIDTSAQEKALKDKLDAAKPLEFFGPEWDGRKPMTKAKENGDGDGDKTVADSLASIGGGGNVWGGGSGMSEVQEQTAAVKEQVVAAGQQTVAVQAQTTAVQEQSSHTKILVDVMRDSYAALLNIVENTKNRGGFSLTASA